MLRLVGYIRKFFRRATTASTGKSAQGFNKVGQGLFLGTSDGALCTEALVCLDTKWFREKCMAGTYVFFECCGSCLLSLDLSARLGFLSISLLVLRTSSSSPSRPSFARYCSCSALLVGFLCTLVAPVLPARLLLVDFAALPEVTALDVQNPSPVVTTFRGCEFVIELESMDWETLYHCG